MKTQVGALSRIVKCFVLGEKSYPNLPSYLGKRENIFPYKPKL